MTEETYILLDTNLEQGKDVFSRKNIDFVVKIAADEARIVVDEEYNSLTDLAIADNNLELRIPWDLLNFRDPSQREIIADLEKGLDSSKIIAGIKIYFAGRRQSSDDLSMVPENKKDVNTYSWQTWNDVSYVERKKESYYIMKSLWSELD